MADTNIAAIFQEAIGKNQADRQQLLEQLAPNERDEILELLAADKMAGDNQLLSSLDYGIEWWKPGWVG